jgi:beta-glucosidase-like glycosyl hydrolase
MNIYRDPRWGRGSETYGETYFEGVLTARGTSGIDVAFCVVGEDPILTSRLVSAIVAGLQGVSNTSKFIKVSAVCKHFTAYSLEAADGTMRFWFDAKVTPQDLADTYLP